MTRDDKLVEFLEQLEEDNKRQELAVLRRSLARRPGEDVAVYRYLGPFLHGPDKDEWPLFLVAGLFALAPTVAQNPEGERGDKRRISLGTSLASYCQEKDGARNGIERRLTAALNAHQRDLPNHLRHLILLLKQGNEPVDWRTLLDDLRHWNQHRRLVQRRWARDFWGAQPHMKRESA